MHEPIHTRQTAGLQVVIRIDPDERLSVRVSVAGGGFTLPARDGHDVLEPTLTHGESAEAHSRPALAATN